MPRRCRTRPRRAPSEVTGASQSACERVQRTDDRAGVRATAVTVTGTVPFAQLTVTAPDEVPSGSPPRSAPTVT